MGVEVNCGHSPRPSSPSPEVELSAGKFQFETPPPECLDDLDVSEYGSNSKDRKEPDMLTDDQPLPTSGTAVMVTSTGLQKILLTSAGAFTGCRQAREKLKLKTPAGDSNDKKRRPLIAKHLSILNIDCAIQLGRTTDFAAKEPKIRVCRTPSPRNRRASPQPPPLRRCRSNVSPLRRRSSSAPRSRPNSPATSVRSVRGPSPSGSFDNIYVEVVRKRVQKTQKARMYLLQQCGPHSFVVGDDSPEHKYKTIIGSQTCTCGRGPHCMHLLFVMLRVFRISDNDPLLWSRQLKNFEVESLFTKYEKRRQSCIKTPPRVTVKTTKSGTVSNPDTPSTGNENTIADFTKVQPGNISQPPEECDECCICLRGMVDDESLVTCTSSCRNKFHHKCLSVWKNACLERQDPFLCPLCRTPWCKQVKNIPDRCVTVLEQPVPTETAGDVTPVQRSQSPRSIDHCSSSIPATLGIPAGAPILAHAPISSIQAAGRLNHRSHVRCQSPCVAAELCSPGREEERPENVPSGWSAPPTASRPLGALRHLSSSITLPRCHPAIPKDHLKDANAWMEIYGTSLVDCLYARDWRIRIKALQRLNQELAFRNGCRVAVGGGGGIDHPSTVTVEDFIRCCCQILAKVLADPVYGVYLSCLQCLRSLLANVPIKSESHLVTLQERVRPIIDTILLRCCDGSKRASSLSLSTIVELCKGQRGELAVGNNTMFPGYSGIGGIGFILHCILGPVPANQDPPSWQWILGRLNVLERLMQEFPEEFQLMLVPPGQQFRGSTVMPSGNDLWSTPIASRLERLMTTLEFVAGALEVRHTNVGKQAREVFMTTAQFAARIPAVLDSISQLAMRDSLLDQRLNSWLRNELENSLSVLSRASRPPALTPRLPEKFRNNRRPSEMVSNFETHPHNSNTNHQHHHRHIYHHRHHNSPTHRSSTVGVQQTHLPSCGGISPAAKVLDRSILQDAFSANRRGSVGRSSFHGVPLRIATPLSLVPPPPVMLHPARHEQVSPSKSGRGADSRSSSVVTGSRPTFLPLNGSFRDVLEWERKAPDKLPPFLPGANNNNNGNVNHSSHGSRYRSPPRPERSPYRDRTTPSDIGTTSISSFSAPSSPSVAIAPVVVRGCSPSKKGLLPGCPFSSRSSRLTASGREVIATNLRSPLKQRFLCRVQSKKICGGLGQVLPSKHTVKCPSGVKKKAAVVPLVMPKAPASTPEDIVVLLDQTVNKQKESVELEEAVTLAKTMSRFVQDELPFIPGLMQYDDEQELVIHVEPENVEDNTNKQLLDSSPYMETVHWRRGSILGKGAFSNCYQARDIRSGTLMAVKQVSLSRRSSSDDLDKLTARIKEEITLMARLDHPHVVRMMGATRQQDHFNMFVEWMPGGSVSCLLEKYGAFTETVIINYTQQVLLGLAYLHDHQILHRDLKGANLLVDSTGQHLRIADFGAAARLASQSTVAGEFQGQVLGTIAFMAPEVLRGENYGRSCDIWSVGCVIFEMATGKPPWDASNISNHYALMYKIACAQESPPIPKHLSPTARDLALRCLELKSEYRPLAKDLLKHPVFHM